jgi:hypothetical protein
MSGQVSLGDIVVQVLLQTIGHNALSLSLFLSPSSSLPHNLSLLLSYTHARTHAHIHTHARCESLLSTKAARMLDVSVSSPTMRFPCPR